MTQPARPLKPPWLAVALLSCAALGYELLLTRLFAQVHWHHLVAVVISLALLGYGASGTFLTLFRPWLEARFVGVFATNALFFGITAIANFHLAQGVPLNPMDMAWNNQQLFYLAAVYLILAVPFFAVANCIGLALGRFPEMINRLYASDLIGAGIGTVLMLLLLILTTPEQALLVLAMLGASAAVVCSLGAGLSCYRWLALTSLVLTATLLLLPGHWRLAGPADYKDLRQALAVKGATVAERHSNPLGVITRVDNPEVPFRFAPGLSLISPQSPPPQSALFLNGDFNSALQRPDQQTQYLAYLSSALAYRLLKTPQTLLLGADHQATLQALTMGAGKLDIVEDNPLLTEQLMSQLGPQHQAADKVELHNTSARRFVLQTARQYDLIQLSIAGGLGQSSGLNAQQQNYRYTLEAFINYWQRLKPEGLLSVTRGLRLPPRDSLKLTTTAIAALAHHKISLPGDHLALIRSWNTTTLLLSRSPLTDRQRQKIRNFSRERLFDLIYLADISSQEINRYNQLQQPYFHQGVSTLLQRQAERFVRDYRFDIRPATDDRPYFHRFTRLDKSLDLLRQPAKSGLAHIDWGVGLLIATLLLALTSSLVLILLPLLWLRHSSGGRAQSGNRVRVLLYFAAIGLAFLLVEIASIQRFQLYLGQPIYAITVVLGGFLVFAGIGSYLSKQMTVLPKIHRLSTACLGLVAVAFSVYITQLPSLFETLAPLPFSARIVICLLLIAPLGIAMGMPFPLGLQRLSQQTPELVPWAWGINGCASVISAILAPLLAMEVGYRGLLILAAGLYLVAYICFSLAVREATNKLS